MPLEPAIAGLVNDFIAAGRPSPRRQTVAERRAGYVASTILAGEKETRVDVRDVSLEGMTLRVISPQGAHGNRPTVIYYHGGCFVSGGFATHEKQLRQLAYHSGCRVIAMQYRMAPEHVYPAAHDDAHHAAMLVWQHADFLGVDREQITLAGDSTGGHIALVTALRLRDESRWLPHKLLLIYPMLDATASFDSYQRNGNDYIITRDTLLSGYEAYFSDIDLKHPEVSPLWRSDFSGLPPTHIITAEYDPLCDEGEALFARLTEQGVSCTAQRYLGVIHGFFQLGGVSQTARNVMGDIAAQLQTERL